MPRIRKADVTAIIPVYNGKAFLREAVESVLNQTLLPKQLIIIDDGSTDGSLEVLKDLKSPIPVVKISQPNAGQSSARNKGVSMTGTEFFALLDQDDYWHPEHIEMLIEPFNDNPELGWTYSNLDQIDIDGNTINTNILDRTSKMNPKALLGDCLAEDMFILPSASIIRKKAFNDVGGFDERLSGYEDDDLFLRLFRNGWENFYVNRSLSAWRSYSASTSFSERMMKSRRIYADKLMQEYTDNPGLNLFYIRYFIAPRFFNIVKNEYWRGIRIRDNRLCSESYNDMKKYSKYFSVEYLIRLKMLIMKFPRLTRMIYRLKHPAFKFGISDSNNIISIKRE